MPAEASRLSNVSTVTVVEPVGVREKPSSSECAPKFFASWKSRIVPAFALAGRGNHGNAAGQAIVCNVALQDGAVMKVRLNRQNATKVAASHSIDAHGADVGADIYKGGSLALVLRLIHETARRCQAVPLPRATAHQRECDFIISWIDKEAVIIERHQAQRSGRQMLAEELIERSPLRPLVSEFPA